MAFHLQPAAVARFLFLSLAVLTAVHVAGQTVVVASGFDPDIQDYVKRFHIDEEQSFPTLFSVACLFLCSALLGWIYALNGRAEGSFGRHWLLLAVVFAYLGFDEALGLHETLVGPINSRFHFSGPFLFSWVVPYAIALLVLTAIFLPFLLRLPARSRLLFLLAGAVYVSGAMGMEMVAAVRYEVQPDFDNVPYLVLATIEELLEMTGVILFIYALLAHIQDRFPSAKLCLSVGRTRPSGVFGVP